MRIGSHTILLLSLIVFSSQGLGEFQTDDATEANRLNLESNSPFIPPGWTPPQFRRAEPPAPPREPPPPPLKIELRGVVDLGDGPRFGLHDPSRGRAFWVEPDEEWEGIRIVDYGEDFKSIVVLHAGRQSEIKLTQRNDTPIEVASSPKPAAQANTSNDGREARREAWRRRQDTREAQEGGPPPGAAKMREAFRNASPEEREVLWQQIGRAVQEFRGDSGQNLGSEAGEAQESAGAAGAAQMHEAFRNASPEEREALWEQIGSAVQGIGGEGEQTLGRWRE